MSTFAATVAANAGYKALVAIAGDTIDDTTVWMHDIVAWRIQHKECAQPVTATLYGDPDAIMHADGTVFWDGNRVSLDEFKRGIWRQAQGEKRNAARRQKETPST